MALQEEEFQIRRLGKSDGLTAQNLFQLFQEVFGEENVTGATVPYLEKLLANPGFVVYAVFHEDEVVGGLTAYELPMYYAEYSEMFIYDIAVKPEFQRKGLGKRLLSSLKEYCRQHGIRDFFVAANEEDTHAVDFYHSTRGEAEKVVYFTYSVEK